MTSTFATPTSSNQDKAAAALHVAQSQRGFLQSFINGILRDGEKRIIEFNGTGSCTSTDRIFLTPPLNLGVYRVHNKKKCDVYDELGNSLCSACREQESFMAVALHECAHNVYGSWQEVDWEARDKAKREWVRNAVERRIAHPDFASTLKPTPGDHTYRSLEYEFGTRFDTRMEAMKEESNYFMPLAALLHPWLPVLVNAVEDARVNTLLHSYRAGTTRMFKVRLRNTMEGGIYNPEDGSMNLWKDAPFEAQLCLYGYLEASDYGLIAEDYFSEETKEVWRDGELLRIIDRVPELSTASEAFGLAQEILARMNELGHLLVEEEESGGGEEDGEEPGGDPGEDGEPGEDGDPGSEEDGESPGGNLAPDEESEDSDDGDGAGEGEGEGDPTEGEPGEDGEGSGEGEGEGDPSKGKPGPGGSAEGETTDGDGLGGGGLEGGREKPSTSRQEAVENAREAQRTLDKLMGHENKSSESLDARMDLDESGEVKHDLEPKKEDPDSWGTPNSDMNSAVTQGQHFDKTAGSYAAVSVVKLLADGRISGTDVIPADWNDLRRAWRSDLEVENLRSMAEAESSAARAVAELRKIFTNNRAVRTTPNLKAGKIDARTVGRKLKTGRVDVFKKKEVPTNKSYAVVIGLDISGSTGACDTPDRHTRMAHMKAAAYAQAELLHKAGIPFLFWCHTAGYTYLDGGGYGYDLQFVEIKGWDEKWGELQKKRLRTIRHSRANLDGYTMMAYRRQLDARPEEVGILMYYTDGSMPAENFDEELVVLKNEVKLSKHRNDLQILCVGVLNNEPEEYGLDTVRYDGAQDLSKVVKRLEKALAGR